MAELFNVVFAGEIAGTADPATVRANVGKLFNASEAVLDKLFSGQPVAIKKMVDRATAMQLRARMKQAGAETRIVAVDEQGRPLAAAAPAPAAAKPAAPAAAPSPGASTPGGSMAARLQALAREQAQQAAAAPAAAAAPVPSAAAAASAPPVAAPAATMATPGGDWGIKPVGSRLSDPPPPPPPAPDVSGISVAAPSGNLVAPHEIARPAPVQVDISGLSMAAAGTEVLKENERRQVAPVQVDISGLSMAEAGTPLEEIREQKPLVNPDISHLKLA